MLKKIMLVEVVALFSSFCSVLYLAVCLQTILMTFCLCGIFVVGPDYTYTTDFFIRPLNSAFESLRLSFANKVFLSKRSIISHGPLLMVYGIIGSCFLKFRHKVLKF